MTPLSSVVAASKWTHEKVTSKSYKPTHGGRPGKVWNTRFGIHEDYVELHNRKFEETRIPIFTSLEEASVFYGINIHKSSQFISKDCGCKTL